MPLPSDSATTDYNNDGLDLDGCENVLIENCDIDTGDDAICLKSSLNPCRNIVVRGCRVCQQYGSAEIWHLVSGRIYRC